MEIFFINFLGLALIVFIFWWFWISKNSSPSQVLVDTVEIVVDGGVYEPDIIRARAGKQITLRFFRKDSSPCAEKVIFPDLEVNADLPLGRYQELKIIPTEKGEFEFTCQMSMYRGKLIVED